MNTRTWRTTKDNSRRILAHFLALVTVSIWGISFISTKVVIQHNVGAVELYIYRFALAYLAMVVWCHKKWRANSLYHEFLFLICGLCGSSIYFIAENTAVSYTKVSDVSMITTLAPLLTTLLIGVLYKNERPGKWVYISSVIAFMGVALIIFKDGFTSADAGHSPDGGVNSMVGNVLALAAAFSWAIYSVVLRQLNANYSAEFISRKTFFYGLVTALPFWFITPEPVTSLHELLIPEVLFNILFLGLCCSLVAYVLWAHAMGTLGAITTNNYLYVQPIITMVTAAILFVNDPLTWLGCTGAILILGGLWLGDYMNGKDLRKE